MANISCFQKITSLDEKCNNQLMKIYKNVSRRAIKIFLNRKNNFITKCLLSINYASYYDKKLKGTLHVKSPWGKRRFK